MYLPTPSPAFYNDSRNFAAISWNFAWDKKRSQKHGAASSRAGSAAALRSTTTSSEHLYPPPLESSIVTHSPVTTPQRTMASALSMESPPFRPRTDGAFHKRSTSSPLSHSSSGDAGGGGQGYSNAVRTHTFQDTNG